MVGRGEERTQSGMLLGTPEFMPPEQVLGQRENVDQQSDIWAVGATMFILLSGENVHPCETVSQFLIAAASQPARTLGSAAPWVPAPICAVVDRALAFEKPNRWPTARAMIESLEQAARAALGKDAPRAPAVTERNSQHRVVAAFAPDAPPRSVGSAFVSLIDDERTAIGRFEARADPPVSVRPDVSFAPADPFEVTTLATGEMLPLDAIESAHLALQGLDGPPSDEERTLAVGPPRGEAVAPRKEPLTIPSVPQPPRPTQGRGRPGEEAAPPMDPNGQQVGSRPPSGQQGPLFGGSHFSGPTFTGPRSQRPQQAPGPAFGSFGPSPMIDQRPQVRSAPAPAPAAPKKQDAKQLYLMLGIGGFAFLVLAVIAAVAMTR
jgi:serine/threonine-protein kinase